MQLVCNEQVKSDLLAVSDEVMDAWLGHHKAHAYLQGLLQNLRAARAQQQQQQQAMSATNSSSSSARQVTGWAAVPLQGSAVPACAVQPPVQVRPISNKKWEQPLGCCGLQNPNNYCYQNTALQLLCCVPELVGPLLGPHAVQLLQGAAASHAASSSGSSSVQGALLAAARAAHVGVQWVPRATVGPAFQALVREMWGCGQGGQGSTQGMGSSSFHSRQAGHKAQPRQQQQQRVSACMKALREAMAKVDPFNRWGNGQQQDCTEFALALLQQLHVSWLLLMALVPGTTAASQLLNLVSVGTGAEPSEAVCVS
jgi:hypothetical protein